MCIRDRLNRAALNALSLEEAIARQSRTWAGDPERRFHLDDAATAARAFRRRCLGNSLLDLSLTVEVFDTQLVRHPEFHRYFRERYRHPVSYTHLDVYKRQVLYQHNFRGRE